LEHVRIPSRKGRGEEGAKRMQVTIGCEVRQGSRPWKAVRLEDISVTGFRIARYPECRRIPGLQLLNAKVCWKEDETVGCEFTQPLHVAVFEHIVRQAGGS
jgi:hypothetical protein